MNATSANLEAPEIQRSRAVFSSEDFELIRTAVGHYLQDLQDRSESVKYSTCITVLAGSPGKRGRFDECRA